MEWEYHGNPMGMGQKVSQRGNLIGSGKLSAREWELLLFTCQLIPIVDCSVAEFSVLCEV